MPGKRGEFLVTLESFISATMKKNIFGNAWFGKKFVVFMNFSEWHNAPKFPKLARLLSVVQWERIFIQERWLLKAGSRNISTVPASLKFKSSSTFSGTNPCKLLHISLLFSLPSHPFLCDYTPLPQNQTSQQQKAAFSTGPSPSSLLPCVQKLLLLTGSVQGVAWARSQPGPCPQDLPRRLGRTTKDALQTQAAKVAQPAWCWVEQGTVLWESGVSERWLCTGKL